MAPPPGHPEADLPERDRTPARQRRVRHADRAPCHREHRLGYQRIQGELLKLGHRVGASTIRRRRPCGCRLSTAAVPEDPLDVAVWQASEPGHPAWDSPWGAGRPGCHAECAVRALSVFGVGVDVHADGMDLRFPHHAYHAAMAKTFTNVAPYARGWLHVGTVTTGGAKMAKSAGNLVLVSDLLTGILAAAVRLMILGRGWADDWDYRPDLLDAAAARLERLYSAAARRAADDDITGIGRLLAADLNAPAAIDYAIETGGAPTRTVATVLGLS